MGAGKTVRTLPDGVNEHPLTIRELRYPRPSDRVGRYFPWQLVNDKELERHGQRQRRPRAATRRARLPARLQSYGDRDFSIYMRRAFAKSMGYSGDELSRPVVGIAFTHSRFNPCHRHFPELLEAVKRGVAAAGGLALEFPTISLHESTLAPNSMKFRNLMAMDTEEMIRAQPMDSVVLMGGCDKTVPAQLMGAASAGKPAIQLIGGPQMTSRYKDDRVGACTDCRKFWTQYRAGKLGQPRSRRWRAGLSPPPAPAR